MKTGQLTVGTTAVRLPGQGFTALKAKTDNTDFVYVGDSTVTSATGYPLDGGEELVVQENLGEVYVVGGAASQVISWLIA